MVLAVIGGWSAAQAASVSVDVQRAVTLYDDGPVDVTTGQGDSFTFRGPSREPAVWTYLRVGHEVGLPMLRVTPEIAAGTALVGTSWYEQPSSYEIRAVGGLRVGLGGPVRPGIYGHAGWGWGLFERRGDGPGLHRENAVTLDGGGYLDIAISKLRFGAHGGYTLFPTWWGNAHTLVVGGQLGVAW
jgi:hypothetical protein